MRPALEQLECRTLMDAGIGIVGRQLFITGSDGREIVYVSYSATPGAVDLSMYTPAWGGSRVFQIPMAWFDTIAFQAKGGEDYFRNYTCITSYVDGGAGNDVLFGGYGYDWLSGGADTDYVNGGYGNDELRGEDGADNLYGGPGSDTLWGGYGNDVLWGEDGNDQLFGEVGSDALHGGNGDDYLEGGYDYYDDFLYGDAGRDTFVVYWHGYRQEDASIGWNLKDYDYMAGDRIYWYMW